MLTPVPQAFERRRGALVFRPLGAWHDHQAFLAARHLIGQRVTMTTRSGSRHHEGVIVAMQDDGAWVWASAISRVRYEESSHRMNSRCTKFRTPIVIVRVEVTDGAVRAFNACPHHIRSIHDLTLATAC